MKIGFGKWFAVTAAVLTVGFLAWFLMGGVMWLFWNQGIVPATTWAKPITYGSALFLALLPLVLMPKD